MQNKNQAEKIAEAKKSVKKWKAEGVDSVACDNIEASENQESCRIKEDFDYDHLTEDMIKEIAKVYYKYNDFLPCDTKWQLIYKEKLKI